MRTDTRSRHELEFLPAALEIVETPASPAGRWTMLSIAMLISAAIAWATIGRVDITATADGRIVPSGRVKLIQPLEIGVVKAIHVADGDRVSEGQPLVELDPTGNAADAARARHDLLQAELDGARLKAELVLATQPNAPGAFAPPEVSGAFTPPAGAPPDLVALARAQLQAALAEYQGHLRTLDAQYAAKDAERTAAIAQIAKLKASLPLLRQRAAIYGQLLHAEFAPKMQYLDAERAVVEQQHDLEVTGHQVDQAAADEVALARQKQEAGETFRRKALDDLADAEARAAKARAEYAKLAEMTRLQTLRAPVSGTVQQLRIHTIGGVVTPAEPLMVIVPAQGGLEVEATINNRDVGFVAKGQPVDVKVEAFNFTRYGLLHGTVESVSRDAASPALDPQQAAAGAHPAGGQQQPPQPAGYIARIVLTQSGFETERGWLPLDPGMQVSAEIKTGRRRIIDYLLSPLARYHNDALTER